MTWWYLMWETMASTAMLLTYFWNIPVSVPGLQAVNPLRLKIITLEKLQLRSKVANVIIFKCNYIYPMTLLKCHYIYHIYWGQRSVCTTFIMTNWKLDLDRVLNLLQCKLKCPQCILLFSLAYRFTSHFSAYCIATYRVIIGSCCSSLTVCSKLQPDSLLTTY